MSTKENFNKAVYDIFGVGSGEAQDIPDDAEPEVFAAAPCRQDSYIASGVYIEGNITVRGDFEIAGELKGDINSNGRVTVRSNVIGNITANRLNLSDCCVTGDINCEGDVTVSEKSIVTGNIKAGTLVCSGRINGNVEVSDNLALDGKSCVVGDISTAAMTVERGAVIKGTIQMREN